MASPVNRLSNLLSNHFEESKQSIFTGMPAKILSYDAGTQSCTAQPIFQTGDLPMPPIYNVPVIFPAGGGAVMTFPVKPGDKCWLSFSMYPIDEFIDGSGDTNVNTNMSRSHDLNECTAFVGIGTTKRNYQPDPDNVMIRHGSTKITLFPDGNAELQGNLHVTGKIVADDTVEGTDFLSSTLGITFNGHKHHYFWTDPGGDADSETPS